LSSHPTATTGSHNSASTAKPQGAKQWARHFLVYGLGVVCLNALSFVVLPIYTRRVPTVEYGILELLNRALDFLGLAVAAGFGIAALSFYQFEAKDPDRQRKVFSTAVLGILLNGALFTLLLLPFSRQISEALFQTDQYAWTLWFVVPLVPLEMVFQLGLISLQARFKSVTYVSLAVGRFAVGLILNLILVYWLRMGLKGILIATAIHTALPSTAIALYILVQSKWGAEWKLWKEMARYGLPFIPGGIFLFILNNGDRYILNMFHSREVVGLYAVSYKIGSIVNLALLAAFLKLWGPVMIEIANRKDGPSRLARVTTHLCATYLYCGLILALVTPLLLRGLVAPEYFGSADAVPLIVLAYLFWAISIVGDTVFYATKKTDVKPLILAAAAAVCLSAYFILIPPFGANGAAWATVLAFLFFSGLTLRVGRRYMLVPYQYGTMALLILFAASLYLSGHFILARHLSNEWVVIPAALIAFPAGLWLLGFFSADEKHYLQNLSQKALALRF
jgi:O-antigen/teichoic acid export membrane protein